MLCMRDETMDYKMVPSYMIRALKFWAAFIYEWDWYDCELIDQKNSGLLIPF